jgi:hypothetical protein
MKYGEGAGLFERTGAILREAQACVFHSRRGGDGALDWLWREVWGPVKCIARGCGQLAFVRGYVKFFTIALPLMFGLLLLASRLGPGSQGAALEISVVLTVVVAFLPTVFSLPSSCALPGVEVSEVVAVADSVASRGRGPEYLSALEENFRALEKGALQTVSGLKWVVAGLWAGWWYAFWQSMKATPVVAGGYARAWQEVTLLMLCFLALLAAYLFTEGYKKGVETMFATVFFAINENKAALAEATPAGLIQPTSPGAAALN